MVEGKLKGGKGAVAVRPLAHHLGPTPGPFPPRQALGRRHARGSAPGGDRQVPTLSPASKRQPVLQGPAWGHTVDDIRTRLLDSEQDLYMPITDLNRRCHHA